MNSSTTKSDYINSLIDSIQILRKLDYIPILKLKEWFSHNKDYRYRIYEERKKITAIFPIDGVYPSDMTSKEINFYRDILSHIDNIAYQFNKLNEFVKVSGTDVFFENEYNELVCIIENKDLIKKWLIKNEEAFFKVYLFALDYCVESDDNSSEIYYAIILKSLGGEFTFSNEDFKGLTKFWNAYQHYFFVEELYKESEHYSG